MPTSAGVSFLRKPSKACAWRRVLRSDRGGWGIFTVGRCRASFGRHVEHVIRMFDPGAASLKTGAPSVLTLFRLPQTGLHSLVNDAETLGGLTLFL